MNVKCVSCLLIFLLVFPPLKIGEFRVISFISEFHSFEKGEWPRSKMKIVFEQKTNVNTTKIMMIPKIKSQADLTGLRRNSDRTVFRGVADWDVIRDSGRNKRSSGPYYHCRSFDFLPSFVLMSFCFLPILKRKMSPKRLAQKERERHKKRKRRWDVKIICIFFYFIHSHSSQFLFSD